MSYFKRCYTQEGISPFSTCAWKRVNCTLKNQKNEITFELANVEVPAFWSETAAAIVAYRYLYHPADPARQESSIRQMLTPVVTTITAWGERGGYFADDKDRNIFHDELTYLLLYQHAAFNTPVWLHVGIDDNPQCSACFILSVDDSIDSLLETQQLEARIFKEGSGTGSNLSHLRSSKEALSAGEVASLPL